MILFFLFSNPDDCNLRDTILEATNDINFCCHIKEYPMKPHFEILDMQQNIYYLTQNELKISQIEIKSGLIYQNNNLMKGSKNFKYIYVQDLSGKIYLYPDKPGIKHSSILSGKPVLNAGEIQVENGIITYISNKSGHYQPDQKSFTQLLLYLDYEGLNLKNTNVHIRTENKTLKSEIKKFLKKINVINVF